MARIAKERLYRTVDDEVVREGDPRAAFLLAAEGDEIPKGFDVPDDDDGDVKAAAKAENKAAKPASNK